VGTGGDAAEADDAGQGVDGDAKGDFVFDAYAEEVAL
jgi:hypothetical protein